MILTVLKYLRIRICFYFYKLSGIDHKTLTLTKSKEIPIIITSFNQLEYLKKLINFLLARGFSNLVIIDNNSTYEPLLRYFDEIKNKATIHRLKKNYGHLVFWKRYDLFVKYGNGYYVVTDPDIVPLADCPEDFLIKFQSVLLENKKRMKVGFGLKIDDIPLSNPNREKVISWEAKFWKKKISEGVYDADIDTTFALYKPFYHRKNKKFKTALRTDYPYVALHGGWYIDMNNLSEEQLFYFKTANDSSSWKIDETGKIANADYEKKY
ncbi:glycosyltransferase family 2 protein [Flavobacterium sp. GT3P67]|uniref:glycosyltransferase family 2 protein n=1 Tax=Flavobacterium sp. GT3P67 TaxID=2541722 RepID=UPI001404B82B|nr:glycosyltransferase family 2 protein [Flavobacterium sp. GT3P67]